MFKVVDRFEYRGFLGSVRRVVFGGPIPVSHNGYLAFTISPDWSPIIDEYGFDPTYGVPAAGPNGGWTMNVRQGDIMIVGFDGLHSWNMKNPVTQEQAREYLEGSVDELIETGYAFPINMELPGDVDKQLGILDQID